MSRYVFLNIPAHGHVNLTLPIVKELVARGQEVSYFLPEEFRLAVEETGATFCGFSMQWSGAPTDLPPDMLKVPVLPLLMKQVRECQWLIPLLIEQIQTLEPDYIVYDTICLWGRIISQALHIPAITTRPSFAFNERALQNSPLARLLTSPSPLLTQFNESVAQLCQRYNVAAFDLRAFFLNKEPLNLIPLPREFQPGGNFFDQSYVFVGHCVPEEHVAVDFPYERLRQEPIIYISFGTIFNMSNTFFHTCLKIFGGTDQQVVIASGNKLDLTTLGPIPDNVIIQPYVPQLDLLRRTKLFITHAGMNSVIEALTLGVPLLMIPQMLEQTMNARQIVALGAGIHLEKENVTEEALKSASTQILQDQSYGQHADELRRILQKSDGPKQAADAIMGLSQVHA